MDQREISTLRGLTEYEAARTAPPPEFPRLPDLPGGRYTDPRFFALEKAHLWRKSWLLAGHVDEVATPGAFKLWESAPGESLPARSIPQTFRSGPRLPHSPPLS